MNDESKTMAKVLCSLGRVRIFFSLLRNTWRQHESLHSSEIGCPHGVLMPLGEAKERVAG
jgi:hypothetical protein